MSHSRAAIVNIQRWFFWSIIGIGTFVLLLLIWRESAEQDRLRSTLATTRTKRKQMEAEKNERARIYREKDEERRHVRDVEVMLQSYLDVCRTAADMPHANAPLAYHFQKNMTFGEAVEFLYLPPGDHTLVAKAFTQKVQDAPVTGEPVGTPEYFESFPLTGGNHRLVLRCEAGQSVHIQFEHATDSVRTEPVMKPLPIPGFRPQTSGFRGCDSTDYISAYRKPDRKKRTILDQTWSSPKRYLRLTLELEMDQESINTGQAQQAGDPNVVDQDR